MTISYDMWLGGTFSMGKMGTPWQCSTAWIHWGIVHQMALVVMPTSLWKGQG